MIWSKARFQHSFELLPRVLKEVAPLLLPISILLWSMEFAVSYLNKARFDDPYSSATTWMMIIGAIGVVVQSLASVIWILYVSRSTQRQMKNGAGEHPFRFLKTHFHQTLVESIRAFISVGIYSIFLIIPGIVRWVQLIFVALVSAYDPTYQKGEKDALRESKRLVTGAWFPLLFLLILQMIFTITLEEMAKSAGLSELATIFLYLASWVISLYFAIYFSLTFFARWSFKLEKA